jgi:maltose/moltooligosaccharide transporter
MEAAQKKKFPFGKTMIVGFGFLGISVLWPLFNNFVPVFLQDGDQFVGGLGLGPTFAFFVMTWDNLINVFVQPWAGAQSDLTWNRFGRRKPWIMIGAPLAAIAFIMIPQEALVGSIAGIMIFILLTNFGMALFRSPTVAWLGDLFTSEERSTANGVINLMGGIGAAIALFGGGMVYKSLGPRSPFIAGAVIMILALSLALLLVKEPEKLKAKIAEKKPTFLQNLASVWNAEDRGGVYILLSILFWFIAYEALQTGLSSFAVYSLGLDAGESALMTTLFAASFILFAIPSGLIATKVGRKRIIVIGLSGLVVLFGLGFFVIHSQIIMAVILVLGGMCWALVNVNSLPLVYDHGDEDKIGAYTGLYYFSSQSAAVIGPVLSGFVIEQLGNDFRWLWIFSMTFMAFAFLSMQGVKNRKPTTAG